MAGWRGSTKKDTPQVDGILGLFQEERKHLVRLGRDLVRLEVEKRQLKVSDTQGWVLAEARLRVMKSSEFAVEQKRAASDCYGASSLAWSADRRLPRHRRLAALPDR